jgi:hypothetical protein
MTRRCSGGKRCQIEARSSGVSCCHSCLRCSEVMWLQISAVASGGDGAKPGASEGPVCAVATPQDKIAATTATIGIFIE